MLFGRTLVCHVIPKKDQHPLMFKIKGKMINVSERRKVKARRAHNERPTVLDDDYALPVPTTTQVVKRRSKNDKAIAKLKAMGVKYDFEEVEPRAKKEPAPAKPVVKKTGKSDAKKAKEEAKKGKKSEAKPSPGAKSPVQTKRKAPDAEVTKSPTKKAIAKKKPKKA